MSQRGSALVAALLLVVIVAAGAALLLPPALRHVEQVEAEQLDRSLDAWVDGLRAFHRDLGRFPTSAEGLAALRSSNGDPRWRGPYVAASLSDLDPWAEALVYDTPGSDRARVASDALTGGERIVSSDLDTSVRAARAAEELEVIVAAADRYRSANGALPTAMVQLAYSWVGGDYLVDPWGAGYELETMQARSAGADGQLGTGDDLTEAYP